MGKVVPGTQVELQNGAALAARPLERGLEACLAAEAFDRQGHRGRLHVSRVLDRVEVRVVQGPQRRGIRVCARVVRLSRQRGAGGAGRARDDVLHGEVAVVRGKTRRPNRRAARGKLRSGPEGQAR